MTATPAQVANDLEAQATFWRKRDDDIAKACLDAAHMIRLLLARRPVDGRSWTGLRPWRGWTGCSSARPT